MKVMNKMDKKETNQILDQRDKNIKQSKLAFEEVQ